MDDVENDYPVYGQVDEIIVWEDEKFFILTELATLSFDHHFMAYEVERTDHKAVVCAMIYHGYLRQRGRVVSASDSQSGGPGFESRSGHLLGLFSVVPSSNPQPPL